MGNATYFLKQAGLSESTASTLNLIMFAIGALGTISSWWLMQFAGRRTIYLWGSATLNVLMLVTGVLGTIKSKGDGKNYATGAILILFTGLYDLTVGPVCYSLVAEIGSTRLRAKTVILARNLYNIGGLVINIINPYMLNSTAWNLAAKSGYVWFGTGILGTIWGESRARSLITPQKNSPELTSSLARLQSSSVSPSPLAGPTESSISSLSARSPPVFSARPRSTSSRPPRGTPPTTLLEVDTLSLTRSQCCQKAEVRWRELFFLEWKTADSIQVSNFVLARHRLSSHQVRLG
jgi:hypothetical protein